MNMYYEKPTESMPAPIAERMSELRQKEKVRKKDLDALIDMCKPHILDGSLSEIEIMEAIHSLKNINVAFNRDADPFRHVRKQRAKQRYEQALEHGRQFTGIYIHGSNIQSASQLPLASDLSAHLGTTPGMRCIDNQNAFSNKNTSFAALVSQAGYERCDGADVVGFNYFNLKDLGTHNTFCKLFDPTTPVALERKTNTKSGVSITYLNPKYGIIVNRDSLGRVVLDAVDGERRVAPNTSRLEMAQNIARRIPVHINLDVTRGDTRNIAVYTLRDLPTDEVDLTEAVIESWYDETLIPYVSEIETQHGKTFGGFPDTKAIAEHIQQYADKLHGRQQ